MAPDSAPDTIVLVHGFWVTPRSWEDWAARYEAKGFTVLAPPYPGFEVEVEALNADLLGVMHATKAHRGDGAYSPANWLYWTRTQNEANFQTFTQRMIAFRKAHTAESTTLLIGETRSS